MIITVYETQDADCPPNKRFAALIDFDGFKGASPHLCSWTRAPTYEEARRKAEDFVEATKNPVKKHKTPADSVTLSEAQLDNAAPPPEEDFPI